MNAEAQVSELLLEWEERCEQGRPVPAEELCRNCPQLLDELDVTVRGGKVVHSYPDGTLRFSRYYRGTIAGSLDLHEFPLDKQKLEVDLEESVFEADQVVFVPGEVRALFPDDMKEQRKKLMATLAVVVNGLSNIEAVLPAASALAKRHAMRQVSLTHLGRSAALIIGTVGDAGSDFLLTITAATPRPVQLRFPKVPSAADLRRAIDERLPANAWFEDVHGSAAYKRHVTHYLAEQIRVEIA